MSYAKGKFTFMCATRRLNLCLLPNLELQATSRLKFSNHLSRARIKGVQCPF